MKKAAAVLLLIFLMAFGVSCSPQEEIGDEMVLCPESSQMKAICELATMECYYRNVAKYKEEDASGHLWWKKDKHFWVTYSGVVTVGIDAARLQMKVEGDQVTISIPEAKVLGITVDEESLTPQSFYVDKDSAQIEAEDETRAYEEAQETMRRKASEDAALLSNAQQRAQTLLEAYVDQIGEAMGREYSVHWAYLE